MSNNSWRRSAAVAGVVIGAQLLSLTVVVGGAVVVGGGIVVGIREINMVKTLVILPIVSSTKAIICDILPPIPLMQDAGTWHPQDVPLAEVVVARLKARIQNKGATMKITVKI